MRKGTKYGVNLSHLYVIHNSGTKYCIQEVYSVVQKV